MVSLRSYENMARLRMTMHRGKYAIWGDGRMDRKRDGGREGGMEGGREGWRDGEMEGGRDGGGGRKRKQPTLRNINQHGHYRRGGRGGARLILQKQH